MGKEAAEEAYFGKRRVLVTGGDRGIGRAVVEMLDRAGASVIIHYNRNAAGAEELLLKLSGRQRHSMIQSDLSTMEGVETVISSALKNGGITDLVNNAGIYEGSDLFDTSQSDWQRVMDTNLRSAFFLIKGIAGGMRGRHWNVVNVSSIMGIAASAGAHPYQASKAALIHLTRSIALELAPEVRVNCVAPGFTMTDMNRDGWEDESFNRRVVESTPLRRWAVPSDIASAVLFLLSDSASFITGQTLLVDGGKSLV